MFIRAFFLVVTTVSFFLSSGIYAQIITGVVLDYETEQEVPFANVYFNSSMHGAVTDENGRFELNIDGYDGQDIVVSCVGYDSWIIQEYHGNKFYQVYLKPSSVLLREILIVHKDMPRKKKERIFLREFLGTSSNASKCKIENIEDVYLVYFKSTKTLEAYCDKPIIIYNKALGYRIRYFLDIFKLEEKNMFYRGNFMFEDDTSITPEEMVTVLRRREKAYDGSRMQFFRELWRRDSYKFKFYLQDPKTDLVLNLDSLVTDITNNIRYLRPVGPIKVSYRSEKSYIDFIDQQSIPFNKSGFFDSKFLTWSGEMANQRIGDLLPFEYWPSEQ